MSGNTALPDRVERDPALSGDEKETTISMCGQDKQFTIFSAKPTIIKSLLQHDHFRLQWARVLPPADETPKRIEDTDRLANSDGTIVAVRGTMPVGVLTIKSKPRATDHQSSVVNAESVDPSVFQSDT